MLTLEPEISDLRDRGHLPGPVAGRLIAIERRAPMSIHDELRVVLWLAVTLITTGLGIFLKKNIDQIGHLTLILIIAMASAACYVITWVRRGAGKASAADDYLLATINAPCSGLPSNSSRTGNCRLAASE